MRIIITLLLAAIFIINIHAQDENIYFDSDRHHIRSSENTKLSNIRKRYSEGVYKILLIGHCDMAGSESYNVILSEKRANSVREHLLRLQIPAEDIQMDFQGETQARQIAETYRKVEIFLISKPKPMIEEEIQPLSQEELIKENKLVEGERPTAEIALSEEKNKPEIKKEKKMTYEGFMESVKPKEQTFKFLPGEMNVIEGKKGTLIRIPENAFVFENGKPAEGEIEFKLTEYYSKKEFLSEGLSTITNGNLLKSAGMVRLEAKAMDQQLKLAKGKDLEILFPQTEENYFTYYGERDEDGIMNWEIDTDYIQEGKKVNLDDFAVTTSKDGSGLELVRKDEARERNKKAKFKGMDGIFIEVTPEYLDSLEADGEARQKKAMELWEAKENQRTLIKSKNLGFINCDRLIDGKNAVEIEYTVAVENEGIDAISAFFVLKDINSVLEIHQQEKNMFYVNARMPVGAKVQIVITGADKDGGLYLFEKEFRLKEKEEGKAQLVRSSYKELGDLMGNANKGMGN